ncbi:MAG TPA: hypothetical protein VMS37_33145 [Verrucomicrobiae bacterium]|nr:hypothetical protein [Verrucomicrobiae bacterium]
MGVLAVPARRKSVPYISPELPAFGATAILYALLVGFAVWHHEPWADEAQSWLLARDASFADLWTRLLHYEGTPGLWQTLLYICTRAGLPYRTLNLLSAACGFAACCLVLRRAPFPIAIRVALPFTFFLCYQYAVVARSYSLVPPLLFGAAVCYPQGIRRTWALTTILCLLAAVSVHGMALSCAIWLAFYIDSARNRTNLSLPERRRLLAAGGCYFLTLFLLVLSAWPASDNIFVRRPYWSFEHLLTVTGKFIQGGFAGGWIASVAAIVLSVPLLWRGGTLLLFVASFVSLSVVNAVIYSQVWHQGLVFLGWLAAVWVAAQRVKPGWPAILSLALVICFQSYWTAESIAYDWDSNYSASREAAAYLEQTGIAHRRLFAIGYACVAIQPYFPSNIFANMYDGHGPSYWDWSIRNHVNQNSERLATLLPDYVIVGYKGTYEKHLWTGQIRESGYRLVRHFEGNTFWQTAIFEPESFDLYRRPAP